MKNALTPAGIKPATYRFVAQHLNHCATAVPAFNEVGVTNNQCVTIVHTMCQHYKCGIKPGIYLVTYHFLCSHHKLKQS